MKRLLMILLVVGSAGDTLAGPEPTDTNSIAQLSVAAGQSLDIFKKAVTPANYKLFGFSSTNEVMQATNGTHIFVHAIALDKLRAYQYGQDFSEVLGPIDRATIPVWVKNNIRSSMTLRWKSQQGGWMNEKWGRSDLANNLVRSIAAIPPADLKPGSVPFAADIPVLNIWFVGYTNLSGKVMLRSAYDLPQLGLTNGATVSSALMTNFASAMRTFPGP